MSLFNIMEWKNVKVFKLSSAFRASAESLVTIGRRGSNLSEIFGVCGPDNVVPAPIGLGTIEEKDPLPTDEELEALYKLSLMDRTRVKTPFADLNCFGYVRALANEMPPEKLAQMDPPTTITIVGCGDPILIQNYMKMTDCPFDVYADPSRLAYSTLGLSVNETAAPEVPQYVKKYSTTSIFKAILISLGLAAKTKSISAGKKSQNGGELIWVDGKIQYIHRMKHTNDHLEVDQLEYLLNNFDEV
ncbi:hypothetical protein E4T50_09646 [Aureobasidium sp. EXF-12298]|nr:hypothetical protein E4T50_09646 [Aureobasidium sp. EXF-12298]KAI4756332.1 hypothetical protein E4T51_10587 [Aureobasidium sp. EXF-12344]KAI4773447.1 hypothetical protein E4T52_11573 [Aureobasidium sp. EXF-3400]